MGPLWEKLHAQGLINPALLPARQVPGRELALGEPRNFMTLAANDVRGGGVIEAQAPGWWCRWQLSTSRDNVPEDIETAETGPTSRALFYVTSQCSLTVTPVRAWVATDPQLAVPQQDGITANPYTAAAEPWVSYAAAKYLPGAKPSQLEPPPRGFAWASTGPGAIAASSRGIPDTTITGPVILAYPPMFYRRATIRTGPVGLGPQLSFEVVVPNGGAPSTWDAVTESLTSSALTPAELDVPAWGAIRVTNTTGGAVSVSLRWA